jgi:hypothetical protein
VKKAALKSVFRRKEEKHNDSGGKKKVNRLREAFTAFLLSRGISG